MPLFQDVFETPRGDLPYLHAPAAAGAPLVIFLHGARDRGSDLEKLLGWGFPKFVAKSLADGGSLPYHFLALQIPEETAWPDWRGELFALAASLSERHGAGPLVLSGFSLGSAGAWRLAADEPSRLAALVIVSGRVPEDVLPRLAALKDVPVRIFHGDRDDKAPLAGAEAARDALLAAGGEIRLDVVPGDHFIADAVYGDPDLQAWLAGAGKPGAVAGTGR